MVEIASAGTHESGTYTEWMDVFLPRTAGRRKMPEPPKVGLEFNGFRFVAPVNLFPRSNGTNGSSLSDGGSVSNGEIDRIESLPFQIQPLPRPVQTGFHFGGYYIPKAGPGMMWEAREEEEGEDGKNGGPVGTGSPGRNGSPAGLGSPVGPVGRGGK